MPIRPLEAESSPEVVGNKAHRLAQIDAAGYSVPAGVVVTTDEYELDGKQPTPMSDALGLEITDAVADLGGHDFAVRSSGVLEDSADFTTAGQYETYLNVPRDDVPKCVELVWYSPVQPRTRAYLNHVGHEPEDMDLAVIIQRMRDADIGGVLFTQDPLSGADSMLVEIADSPEQVVDGGTTPETYRLAPSDAYRNSAGSLSTDQLGRLVEAGRGLERLFDGPQNIEWAFEDDVLWILQSRPISAVTPAEVKSTAETEASISGLGVSPGSVTGPAIHVSRDRDIDVENIRSDHILVCDKFDPTYTDYFKNAGGIVTDTGGALSHAGMIARELQLPAVTGTNNATDRIADGDQLTIDGGSGSVYIQW